MNSTAFLQYEVFVRSSRGLDHKHVGSLQAPNAESALLYARDCYIRRAEGVSIWVVESSNITASVAEDVEQFVDPMTEKPYRHATHYVLPEQVKNI